jgi:hypothetical protein
VSIASEAFYVKEASPTAQVALTVDGQAVMLAPMRTLVVAAILALAFAIPSTAAAQEPDFTPVGYTFCGWKDFTTGHWVDEPEDGVWERLFARNMTCRTAKKNFGRLRYTQTPPYRPVKAGYRCVTLDQDYEYGDVRCSKKGRPRVAFRVQSGA